MSRFDRWDWTLAGMIAVLALLLFVVRAPGQDSSLSIPPSQEPSAGTAQIAASSVPALAPVSAPAVHGVGPSGRTGGAREDTASSEAAQEPGGGQRPDDIPFELPPAPAELHAALQDVPAHSGAEAVPERASEDALAGGPAPDRSVVEWFPVSDEQLERIGSAFSEADVAWPAIVARFNSQTAESLLKTAGGWIVLFDPAVPDTTVMIHGGLQPLFTDSLPSEAPASHVIMPLSDPSPEFLRWKQIHAPEGSRVPGWLAPEHVAQRVLGTVAMVLNSLEEEPGAVELVRGRWEGSRFVPFELRLHTGETRSIREGGGR